MLEVDRMDERHGFAVLGDAVEVCVENYRLCRATAHHCRQDDALESRACMDALDDCAEGALLLANFLLRRSPLAVHAADLVREAARRAADAIAERDHEDVRLRTAYASCQAVVRIADGLLGEAADETADDRDEALEETFPASDATPTVSQAV